MRPRTTVATPAFAHVGHGLRLSSAFAGAPTSTRRRAQAVCAARGGGGAARMATPAPAVTPEVFEGEGGEDEEMEMEMDGFEIESGEKKVGFEEGDEDEEEEFDEESEDELRKAAETLKGSGVLGLGGGRTDGSELASFALGEGGWGDDDGNEEGEEGEASATPARKGPVASPALSHLDELAKQSEVSPIVHEDDDEGEEDAFDGPPTPGDDDLVKGPRNLDAYTDDDEHDDEGAGFGVTSTAAFGRVWELNDDAYVTISEPGEAYAYDIDEAEIDDLDTAVMRRGAAGGWGGSLAADERSELEPGSREWVARRAYDLVLNASKSEMFKWTRARKSPPAAISELFAPEPPAAPMFGPTALDSGGVEGDEEWLGEGGAPAGAEGEAVIVDMQGSVEKEGRDEGHDAIERSVDFPCMYKFKVVGGGEDFVEGLSRDMENVLGRKVPSTAFEFEPAGRYQRILISVEVESARQVTELYEAVRVAQGVKFSYG